MNCYRCGSIVDGQDVCPVCQANIHVYRKIIATANAHYNDGLIKAEVRDLSGTIKSLKMCLKYNKYHTDARNLLGLVYFEVGEMVLALAEWVVSKNLQPDNNIVDKYLGEIQNTQGMLETMNTTIKKYNQAIEYCRQGNRDLARIQLRRVIGQNPKMVSAHQLLALLCIQDNEYEEARKSLLAANKIDARNITTLRYMLEVKAGLKEKESEKKKKKRQDDVISFTDGNETIMMPNTNSFQNWFDSSKSSIINILIGLGIGLLICFVLVVPTVKQNANSDAASALVDANEEVAGTTSSIENLKKQVSSLQQELAMYQGKGDTVTSYEKLIEAYNAYKSNDINKASEAIDVVNVSLLGDTGKMMYEEVSKVTNEKKLKEAYKNGVNSFNSKKYDEAISNLAIVLFIDPTYHNSDALYYMAESYAAKNDIENAKNYYTQLLQNAPNSRYAKKAKDYLTLAGVDVNAIQPNVNMNPAGGNVKQSGGNVNNAPENINNEGFEPNVEV